MAGKKYKSIREKIQPDKAHSLDEALKIVADHPAATFDESIDVSLCLGVDTKQSDQQVRGFVALPHGLGRTVRILVFAKGESEEEAKKAGADYVGAEDFVDKIKEGWMDFDRVISTPDMMPLVSKVAKILGPKGLMPNPKLGTVTMKVAEAVETEKKGKASFRADKNGVVHSSIGRRSMGYEGMKENLLVFLKAVLRAKPSSSKGVYLKKVILSSTMGPGILADVNESLSMRGME